MMFQTIVAACFLSNAVALAPMRSMTSSKMVLRSSVPLESVEPIAPEPIPPTPPVKKVALNAKWFPFAGVKAPLILDGTLAGDAGFDPVGFSKDQKSLYWQREAEVKHARLAMLAAIGWPLSELWHKDIAQFFGLQSILAGANGDRAPSLFNGGLDSAWASSMLVATIAIAGFLESKAMEGAVFWNSEKPEGFVPGDYGFDPLRLYKSKGDKKVMETAEIKNGRLAMLAVTGYVFSEVATGLPVVQETPFLF